MRRSGSTWTTMGLIVLAVVAIVLAFAALRSTRGTGGPAPLASALTNPSDKPGKNQGDKGDSEDQELEDALPDTIEPPLLMVSPTLAYRARTGTCLGGSVLERSNDGGRHWKKVTSPAPAILSLSSTGGEALDAVGADGNCKMRTWSSTDAGGTWSAPASASDTVTRVPGDPSMLSTPDGDVKSPCPVRKTAPVAVDALSNVDAVVLCESGDMFASADAGASWEAQTPVVGGQALSFESPELGWVLQRDSGNCPAYQLVQTQDAGITWQTGGCLGTEPITDSRQLPSLSFADGVNGMADLAGDVYVTDDSGLTWQGPL